MAEHEAEYEQYDVEEILAEIEREREMKEMLGESIVDLEHTLQGLEEKLNDVGKEGNEWKTRYETQVELNQQLERQLEMLKGRVKASGNSKRKNAVDVQNVEEMSESGLKNLVRQLEKEKLSMEGQLRDMEWRLDQESKAFHKASEGRRKYMTELNEHSFLLNSYKKMEKTNINRSINERKPWTKGQRPLPLPPIRTSKRKSN